MGAGADDSCARSKLAECIGGGRPPAGRLQPGDRARAPWSGDEIAANPGTQAVGFIGSIATGHRVAERAAGKELLLEMGGNGPLVVLEDADLDAAVAATLTACFLNAGQSCTAGERILVHEEVHDEYLALLRPRSQRRSASATRSTTPTTMGPLNNEPTADKTERHVARSGRARAPAS